MDNLVKDILTFSSTDDTSDDYILMNSKYIPEKIDNNNFHLIDESNSNGTNFVDSKLLFVDGGSSVLFESAEFCIGFVRVGAITYIETKRLTRHNKEFYLFVREIKGKYSVKTYPQTPFDNLVFDPEDETLKNGIEKCSISKIVAIIRRFAEIEFSTDILDNDESIDFVIMDGTLEARYPHEDKYLEKLFLRKKTIALSKTCTLTTKNGYSITKKLLDLNDLNSKSHSSSWYYFPIVINNNPMHFADIYFIKLNENSDYVFRFETQKNLSSSIKKLFFALKKHSKDPIFLGYPYGLIDVDQQARISEDESKILRTKISVKLGKDWNNISKHLNSTNAHSILDKIKF